MRRTIFASAAILAIAVAAPAHAQGATPERWKINTGSRPTTT